MLVGRARGAGIINTFKKKKRV